MADFRKEEFDLPAFSCFCYHFHANLEKPLDDVNFNL